MENSANEPKKITKQETEHLEVSYVEMKKGTVDDQDGFYLRFKVKQLSGEPFQADDYSFTLQDILIDKNGHEYKTISNERLTTDQAGDPLPADTIHFQQFYSPKLSNNLTTLPVTFYIKPTYYNKNILFENIHAPAENVLNNDLLLQKVSVDGKKLSLVITDVHDVKGLKVSLLLDGETIYPVFSKTEYGKLSNSLFAEFEFAKPLPETFSLTVTRYRLQDIVQELPFNLPIYYPY